MLRIPFLCTSERENPTIETHLLTSRAMEHGGQIASYGWWSVLTLGIGFFLIYSIEWLWVIQKTAMLKLLKFAGVPFHLSQEPILDLKNGLPVQYEPGGSIIRVPMDYAALNPVQSILLAIVLVIAGVVIFRIKAIPLPFQMMSLFVLLLVVSTVLYTGLVSPVPPHLINMVAIDWQYSGAIVLFLIGLIFTFSVFPVKGSFAIKSGWLTAVLAYGVIWNIVRLALVLATFYHLGSTVFLLTHYMTGIYIDFIYIVAFYSLALGHLAKSETSEVGW